MSDNVEPMNARRWLALLVALWAGLTLVRWLAALPITEPRIFQDELLHWQMAKEIARHQPFLLFGRSVDTPAVLYPAILSIVFQATDARMAFDLARGVNAALLCAVVFPAYGLAREFAPPPLALATAALAALVPGGVFSALIMEESLYYPLFVLSCWLCFRLLTKGTAREALACSAAVCVTYFAKPLVVPLIFAYTFAVAVWFVLESRRGGGVRERLGQLGLRLTPILTLALALYLRHAIVAAGTPPQSASELLLSRTYSGETSGPLIPDLWPLAKVTVALLAALALGVGVAPLVCLLSIPTMTARDRRWFVLFVALVVGTYVLAIGRHTLVMNPTLRPHERYLFPVAPLLLTLFLTNSSIAIRRPAAVLVVATIMLTIWPLGPLMLSNVRTIDAPSLTTPFILARDTLGNRPATAVFMGLAALLVTWGATRARVQVLACFAWLAALPIVLNFVWYRDLYSQTYLKATSRFITRLERSLGPTQRVAVVVQDGDDVIQRLVLYQEFWLDDRSTGYWAGEGPAPWYTESSGPAPDVVRRTGASYLIGKPGLQSTCPTARIAPGLDPGPPLSAVVLDVTGTDCR